MSVRFKQGIRERMKKTDEDSSKRESAAAHDPRLVPRLAWYEIGPSDFDEQGRRDVDEQDQTLAHGMG